MCRFPVRVMTLLVIWALSAHLSVANEQWTDEPAHGFDIAPAINHVLTAELHNAIEEPLHHSERSRRIAAAMLAMPVVAGPTGPQTGGGSPTTPRRPGDWLVGGFDRSSRWATLGIGVALAAYLATADDDDIAELGDITQLVPIMTGVGLSIGVGDWEGLRQISLAGGTSFALTHGIKELTGKMRPDATSANSFPSGHTSASTTGAAFLWRRYGAKWGAPASLLAAYTGISRIVAERHFGDDVISGMAIGLISNWLFTEPIDERARIALFPTKGGAALQISLSPGATRPAPEEAEEEITLPGRTFLWEIGGAWVQKNLVTTPNLGGTPIDFQFEEENDPTTTALVGIKWSTADFQHNLRAHISPFEIREVFVVDDELEFAGTTFEEGTELQSRYLAYDYRIGYSYALVNDDRFRLNAGASVAVFETEVALTDREDVEVREHVVTLRPVIDLSFGWALSEHWLGFVTFAGWSDSDFRLIDASAQAVYRLADQWALSLGFRRVERRIDVVELYNQVNRNQTALGIWYLW